MDSFELNKIAGAVLFALLVSFGLSIASEMIFETEVPEAPGYVIAVAEPTEDGEAGAPAATQAIGVLLASADASAGESSAKKCVACHSFAQGEANKVGPNLWEIVNRPVAGHEGYEYSADLQAYAQQAQTWTYENLNAFIQDPKGVVAGTKMAFAGLKDDAERANVIAYLRGLSANPAPLPPPEAAPAEAAAPAPGAPAPEGEAAAGTAPSAEAAAPAAPAAAPDAEPAGEAGTGGESAAAPQATEGASESGMGGGNAVQPQGSLGAVDAAPADQQGAVPQVPAIEQPRPEPSASDPAPAPAEPVVPAQPANPAAPADPGAQGAAAPDGNQVSNAQTPPAAEPTAPAEPQVAQQAPAQAGAAPAAPPPAAAPPAAPAPAAAAPAAAPPAAPAPAAPAAAPPAAPAPAPAAPAAAAPAPPAPAAPAPAAAAPAGGGSPFGTLVASADAAKGGNLAKRCAACHSFDKGGANKVGPALWDVVNRPVASVPGYSYSQAMIAFSAGGAKRWTVDELNPYLEDPKAHVPGTKMVYPGLKKEDERASLVAYLRSLSDNPVPLP